MVAASSHVSLYSLVESTQRVYGIRLLFVSARTNKRHHHHAPRDASASSFRATPTVPSRRGICSALALAGLALGHKPHAQRRPSLDQMGVPRLHLPMAPGIRSALALAGLALGVYVPCNFRSRGAITARRPRVPASVILARPHPSQWRHLFFLAPGHRSSSLLAALLRVFAPRPVSSRPEM
jgi:hypothetical protein